MKCTSDASEDTSMSAERCSVKLRILALVVTTADLINERSTPTLGIYHSIISPITIFSTYFFLSVFVASSLRKINASFFLQTYALIACSALHMYLAIVVFKELRRHGPHMARQSTAGQVLNGVLPMLIIFILLADLIVLLFSNRSVRVVLPESPRHPSQAEIQAT